jgi:hypothetical protein
MTGPYETEHEARTSPEVRAVWEKWYGSPSVGGMAPHNLAMLTDACSVAGVTLGEYDRRILTWVAQWEPQTAVVIAGIIRRAGMNGPEDDDDVLANPNRCSTCHSCRAACQCPGFTQMLGESGNGITGSGPVAQVISLADRRRA